MSRKYYVRQIAALFLASCLFFNTSFVLAAPAPLDSALPYGHTEPYGGVGAFTPGVDRLDITGVENGAVIRWENFDIGADATVQFQQVSDSAWVLNRVLAADNMATGIMGELLANGGLIVVNPHGIVFGDGAFVDARSFIASGLDIDELAFRNFADGTITDLQFQGYLTGGYGGNLGVLNNGTIGTGSAGDFAPTGMIYLIGKTVTNKGSIITSAGGCVVMAAGENVYLSDAATSNVTVQVAMTDPTDPGEHVVDNGGTQGTGPGTVDSDGGKIILAAGDIFSTAITGIESLRAEAFRNITLEGAATATGNIELIADSDLGHGGDVTTNGAITAGGNVDIAGNLIELNEDVSANGGDLTITGRTSEGLVREENLNGYENGPEGYWGYIDVAEAKTLYASHDVKLIDAFGSGGEEPPAGKMDLFGHVSLAIEAAGGEIKTEGPWGPDGVKITVEDTSPASLTMKQSDPLNLVDYTFGNQNNTELTLESYNGSVAAADSDQLDTLGVMGKDDNAADQWRSITATAYTDITLQGHDSSRDITAKALASTATDFDTGNITVTSDNGKVLVTEDVIANQGSISLTAIDTDNGGIVSSGNITASDGITLFGEVTADKDGPQLFDAGQGTLWAKDTLSTITKTKTGGLMLAADTLVDLDGIDGTTSDSVWVTDGTLTIDGPVDVEGNLRASGLIHLQGTTNNVAGDILSTGSGIIFDHDVIADGVGSQLFDAGSDLLIAENEADIDKVTAGSLTLAGDSGIELGGNVTGNGMESGDKLTFENNVTADGTGGAVDQRFDAGLGALDADGSITKTTDGKLNIGGEEGIELGGNVETRNGDLTLENAVTANGSGDQMFDAGTVWASAGNALIAEEDIDKTTDGKLTLDAGRGDSEIRLAGDVTTRNGDLVFEDRVVANGSGDQMFDAGTVWSSAGNALIAEEDIDKTTDGSLTLDGGRGDVDSEIYLAGDVKTTNGDLTFEDKVIANGSGSQRFDALGGKLWAQQTITKTTAGTGDLNLGGDDAIDLDGTVDVQTTDGSLIIEDSFTAAGNLLANDDIKVGSCSGTTGTWANGEFDGVGNQQMYADGGAILVNSSEVISGDAVEPYLKKTTDGDLTIDAGSDMTMRANVTVNDGSLDILADGTAGLYGNLKSTDDMTLSSSGRLRLHGNAESTGGSVAMTGGGDGIWMYGKSWGRGVKAAGDILLNSDTHVTYTTAASGENQLEAGGDVYLKNGKHLMSSFDASLHVKAGDNIILGASDQYNPDAGGSAGNVSAGRDLVLDAGDDIYVYGDVSSTGGSVSLYSSDWTTYLWGDVEAAYDVLLNGNTMLEGEGDQTIEAAQDGYGTLTAEGWVWKTTPGDLLLYGNNPGTDAISLNNNRDSECPLLGCLPAASTCLGNLEIYAPAGDIQISGDLTTFGWCSEIEGPPQMVASVEGSGDGECCLDWWYDRPTGGVSVIADSGKIYTDGAGEEGEYMLNIGIVGNSDHYKCLGVDLPYDDGKAAIVVMSSEDLKLGPDSMLIARGNYYDAGGLDIWDFIDFTGVESYGQYFDIFDELFDELGGCIADHDAFCSAVWDFVGGLDEAEFDFGDLEGFKELFTDFVDGYFEDLLTLDDRPAVGFLDVPATTIGGIPRDEGDPIDVAVYLASTQGNVELDGRAIDVEDGGTMVVDAYDTVSFGDFDTFSLDNFDLTVCEDCIDAGCVLVKLLLRFGRTIMEDFEGLTLEDVRLMAEEFVVANGYESLDDYIGYLMDEPEAHKSVLSDFLEEFFGEGYFFNIDRLEVSSRITEWLYQAVNNGTLPYADNPAVVEDFIGGDYILRGAGLGNLGITDGRAWVLENPIPPAPLYTEAGQEPEEQEFAPGGCPALMAWLANEIGVPAEEIQVYVANTFAFSTDIQPCEVCSTLKDAATILADADGTSIAALAGVVNEYITPGAPIAPEQMTLIAAAVTNADAGTVYAAAGQWLDAMALYVGLLNSELGYSAADSVAFAGKYTAPVTTGGNAALAGYVEARLAELGL